MTDPHRDHLPRCAGIIVEYNPFHNGHLHHLEETRRLTGASHIVAVMSGDFMQRGEPAIYDKHIRTRMALEAGVDLVLELPALFATSSAEDFAGCAVHILEGLGVVDSLCFGSECGRIEPLSPIAQVLAQEPESYTAPLRRLLREGLTFPHARSRALIECLEGGHGERFLPQHANGPADRNLTSYADILSQPNNILGIEYMKALLRQGSHIHPRTLPRSGSGYHDPGLSGQTASASAIRGALHTRDGLAKGADLHRHLPEWVLRQIEKSHPLWPDDFSSMLNYLLLDHKERGIPLEPYLDWSRELADRISRQSLDFNSFTGRCLSLKTRQYTYTRVSRCLLHLLLGITGEDAARHRAAGYCGYARVLGFRRDSAHLMGSIKRLGSIKLISKTADAHRHLKGEDLLLFQKDLFASHVYQAAAASTYHGGRPNEYTRSPIIL